MDSNFIQKLAPQRVAQRGFDPAKSYGDFRHFRLAGHEKKHFAAYNQLWYLVGDVDGVRISSNYGDYNQGNFVADEHQHEHTDQIEIENLTNKPVDIRFYQIFLRK